jgi:hypothetical protein
VVTYAGSVCGLSGVVTYRTSTKIQPNPTLGSVDIPPDQG